MACALEKSPGVNTLPVRPLPFLSCLSVQVCLQREREELEIGEGERHPPNEMPPRAPFLCAEHHTMPPSSSSLLPEIEWRSRMSPNE